MNEYVLDTSALLAYTEDEEGSTEVEALLNRALDDEIALYISVISSIEEFYISWQEQGEEVAIERLNLIGALSMIQVELDQELVKIIGEIKAKKTISFADCCIAGLAKYKNATLVHKDPEYEEVEDEIKQLKLPYKQISKSKPPKAKQKPKT